MRHGNRREQAEHGITNRRSDRSGTPSLTGNHAHASLPHAVWTREVELQHVRTSLTGVGSLQVELCTVTIAMVMVIHCICSKKLGSLTHHRSNRLCQ